MIKLSEPRYLYTVQTIEQDCFLYKIRKKRLPSNRGYQWLLSVMRPIMTLLGQADIDNRRIPYNYYYSLRKRGWLFR